MKLIPMKLIFFFLNKENNEDSSKDWVVSVALSYNKNL